MTKEEILAGLKLEDEERFNEAVKAFSSAGMLAKVRYTARILVLKDGTEITKEQIDESRK